MRLNRFASGFPLQHEADVVLPLDALHANVPEIAMEETLAGPKRLLEESISDPSTESELSLPVFCPNPACTLARRPWPSTATICALCRTRLVPRASIVAEELIGHAMRRALFELERSTGRPVRPDIALASTPIDWSADIRYRYLDFLKISFPGVDVRLIDDPVAIARDAAECPDAWKLTGPDGVDGTRLAGIFPNERVLVIDSGAKRTQFYTAVSSPRIGYFDPSYSAVSWGGADCDYLIASTVADHLQVDCDAATLREWTRPIRLWKEALSAALIDGTVPQEISAGRRKKKPGEVQLSPLHLPIGSNSAETLAVGPPPKELAAILSAIEHWVDDTVGQGLEALGVTSRVDIVLLAGGNARWPFFEMALRKRMPDVKIARPPDGHASVVNGLSCSLIADTVVWRLAPGEHEEVAVEEPSAPPVPTISELFAAAPVVEAALQPEVSQE